MQQAQGTTIRQTATLLPSQAVLIPSANAQRQRAPDIAYPQQQGMIEGKNAQLKEVDQCRITSASTASAAPPTETQSAAPPAAPTVLPEINSTNSGSDSVPAPESSYCFGPSGKKERLRRIQINGDTTWVIPQRFRFLKRIGSGAYGCVASFEEAGENGNSRVAVKKIGDLFRDLVDAKRILREIKILKALKHENLIDLIEILDPLTPDFEDIYLVSDLMDTDLHRVIYSRQPLTNEHHQYFLYQILLAVAFLHEADVIHRDLKPSNVLVNLNCDVKICDFGLARGVGVASKAGSSIQQQQDQEAVASSGVGDCQMNVMETDTPPQAAAGARPSTNPLARIIHCPRPVGNPSAASLQGTSDATGLLANDLGDLELTDYVVTRWYRPPELLIFPFHYSKPVDIWSVGCIMAELLGRRALFAGKDQYDQLRKIVRICGSPSPQDLSFLLKETQNTQTGRQTSKRRMKVNREFIEQLPASEGICFSSLFPDACPQALDLLRRLLAFNPSKRITAIEALRHPYFRGLYCPEDEPKSVKPMDWSFDNFVPTKRLLQNLIYQEILSFHPDIAVRDRALLHTRGVSTEQLLPLLPCTQGTTIIQSDQNELQQQKQQKQQHQQQQHRHHHQEQEANHSLLAHRSCCSAPAASSAQFSSDEIRQQPSTEAAAAAAPVAVASAAAGGSELLATAMGLTSQMGSFCPASLSLQAQKQQLQQQQKQVQQQQQQLQQQQQQLMQGFHLNSTIVHHQLMQQRRQNLLRQQSPYCLLQQDQQRLNAAAAAVPPRHTISSGGPMHSLVPSHAPSVATAPNLPVQRSSHHNHLMQQQQQNQQHQQQPQQQTQQFSPRVYASVLSTASDEPLRHAASAVATERLPCYSPLQHMGNLKFPVALQQQQQQIGSNCCDSFCCERSRLSGGEGDSLLLPHSTNCLPPQHHTTSSTAATTTDAAPRSSGSAVDRNPQQQRCSTANDAGCCAPWPTTGSRNTTRSSLGEEPAFGGAEMYPQQQHQQITYLHRLMQQQMNRQQQLAEQQKQQQQQQFARDQLQQLHLHSSAGRQLQQQGAALHVVTDYRDNRGNPAPAATAATGSGYTHWLAPPQKQQQQEQQHYQTHN